MRPETLSTRRKEELEKPKHEVPKATHTEIPAMLLL